MRFLQFRTNFGTAEGKGSIREVGSITGEISLHFELIAIVREIIYYETTLTQYTIK